MKIKLNVNLYWNLQKKMKIDKIKYNFELIWILKQYLKRGNYNLIKSMGIDPEEVKKL